MQASAQIVSVPQERSPGRYTPLLKGILILLGTLQALFLQSCATRYAVFGSVEAYSDGTAPQNYTYAIVSGNPEVPSHDLEFLKYRKMLARSLARQNMTVTDSTQASAIIYLGYGKSAPQRVVVSEETTANTNILGDTVSMETRPNYATYYDEHIELVVYARQSERQSTRQIWKTATNSRGTRGDLLWSFPYLLLLTENYYGGDSGGKVSSYIYLDDPRIYEINGLPPPPPPTQ